MTFPPDMTPSQRRRLSIAGFLGPHGPATNSHLALMPIQPGAISSREEVGL